MDTMRILTTLRDRAAALGLFESGIIGRGMASSFNEDRR
jgi:hypothetical protein